jgi:hypothetical protein
MKTVDLLEYTRHTGPLEIDEVAGAICNVRVLGLESANGRRYDRDAVKRAIPLYEGKQINIDHPSRASEPTSVARRFGWLEGVYQDTDGGLRARKLHYLKSHPLAAPVVEAARRNPALLGLSHNAQGKERRGKDGIGVIESIEAVHSVDLVADPATVAGLHEGKKMRSTVSQLIEDLRYTRPGVSRALTEMAEAGLVSADTPMDAPPAPEDGGEDADHETALKTGFRAAIIACLDDESMDLMAKVKRIKEILKTEEKLLAKEMPAAEAPADDDGEAKEESRRLKLEVAGLKQLMEAGIHKPDAILLKALSACRTEDEVRQIVGSAKGRQPTYQGARSATPGTRPTGKNVQEQRKQKSDTNAPDSPADLAKWLQSN